jgi:ABC-type glycerol-3-phosphate transport system permease component
MARHLRWGQIFRRLVIHVALIVGSIACLVPFMWMLSTSFKLPSRVLVFPPEWIPNPLTWENYVKVFTGFPFARYLMNTVTVTVSVVVTQLFSCSLAAYAFARLQFPGRDRVFLAYLGTLMIPAQVTMIPTYILMKYMHMIDTLWALIVPAAFGSAFGTFLLRQFFMTLPRELEDAARLDGCGYFGIYRRIILPLSRPALATLAVFTFLGTWNDFFWPLIVLNSDLNKTLTIGLVTVATTRFGSVFVNVLMAGATVSILPSLIVFFSAQRYFIQGIAFTGMKT